jgi:hypothetical protein
MSSSLPQKSLPISDCPLPISSSSFVCVTVATNPPFPNPKTKVQDPAKIGNWQSEIGNNFPWLNQHKLGRESY